jgi:hypothetical protein
VIGVFNRLGHHRSSRLRAVASLLFCKLRQLVEKYGI